MGTWVWQSFDQGGGKIIQCSWVPSQDAPNSFFTRHLRGLHRKMGETYTNVWLMRVWGTATWGKTNVILKRGGLNYG